MFGKQDIIYLPNLHLHLQLPTSPSPSPSPSPWSEETEARLLSRLAAGSPLASPRVGITDCLTPVEHLATLHSICYLLVSHFKTVMWRGFEELSVSKTRRGERKRKKKIRKKKGPLEWRWVPYRLHKVGKVGVKLCADSAKASYPKILKSLNPSSMSATADTNRSLKSRSSSTHADGRLSVQAI